MQKTSFRQLLIIGSLILVILPSCVTFRLKRTLDLDDNRYTIEKRIDDVSFKLHPLSKKDNEKNFQRDLLEDGYYAFSLTVENSSSKTLMIEPSYIELPLASPSQIAKLLHYNTSLHMQYSSALSALFFWPIIPLVIYPTGLSMEKCNQKINRLMKQNSIGPKSRIKIKPYTTVQKLFFIAKEDFTPRFVIKCRKKNPEKTLLSFNVNLLKT